MNGAFLKRILDGAQRGRFYANFIYLFSMYIRKTYN